MWISVNIFLMFFSDFFTLKYTYFAVALPIYQNVRPMSTLFHKFIKLFFRAIEEGTSKEEKVKRINELFNYSVRSYKINYDDLRIDLGKKRY